MYLVAMVCFVVLMILWLLGGGYVSYSGPTPNPMYFGACTLIPWFAVLILGLIVFGAFSSSSTTVVPSPSTERR